MSQGVRADAVYKAMKDCAVTEVGEEIILLHLGNGTYYGLNETGHYLWSLLKEGATFPQMLEGMENRFDADKALLEQDLHAFLAGLIEHDLLLVDEPARQVAFWLSDSRRSCTIRAEPHPRIWQRHSHGLLSKFVQMLECRTRARRP